MVLKTALEKIRTLSKELEKLKSSDLDFEKKLQQRLRLEYCFYSNSMAGNSLTYNETKILLSEGFTTSGKTLRDHLQMRGYVEALVHVEDFLSKGGNLTEAFIKRLNQIIIHESYDNIILTSQGKTVVKRVETGRYKIRPNNIKIAGGESVHFTNPEDTPENMGELIAWYHRANAEKKMSPVMLASQFHYRFFYIHPFDEGNGRTGRMLMNLVLMMHKLPPLIIKPQHVPSYFKALQIPNEEVNEPFAIFVAEHSAQSMQRIINMVKAGKIEEDDYIDQEIAAMKEKKKNDKLEDTHMLRNITTQRTIFHQWVKPLIENTLDKLEKFDSQFTYKELSISIGSKRGTNFTRDKLMDIFTNAFANTAGFDRVRIDYKWKGFKKSVKPFDYEVMLEVVLEKTHYTINVYPPVSDIRSGFYNEMLNESDCLKIAATMASGFTRFIQHKKI